MSLQQAVYPMIVGGVDTPKDLHVAAAVDGQDQVPGTATFSATRHGYITMLAWMLSFGEVTRIGIECSGTYGTGLLGYLQQASITTLGVTSPDKSVRRKKTALMLRMLRTRLLREFVQ